MLLGGDSHPVERRALAGAILPLLTLAAWRRLVEIDQSVAVYQV
jgi:hypothetical protein